MRAGEVYDQAGHQAFAGIQTSAGEVDLAAIVGQKDELVDTMRREKYLNLRDPSVAGRSPRGSALRFALTFSSGLVVVLLPLGAVISAGGRRLASSVTFTSASGIALRSIVGVLLVVLGLIQVEVIPVSFHGVERFTRPIARRQAELRRRRPLAGHAAFGAAYLLIGFG